MIVVASQGRVPAPVDEVWAVVRQVETLPAWLAGVRQVVADGPEGLGRRLWLAGSRAGDGPRLAGGEPPRAGDAGRAAEERTGGGLDRRAEVIAWKPPTLLAWRWVAQRGAGGVWEPTRPDELHLQLVPVGDRTDVRISVVRPAGLIETCWLRLVPAWVLRARLSRSVTALAELFSTPLTATSPPAR